MFICTEKEIIIGSEVLVVCVTVWALAGAALRCAIFDPHLDGEASELIIFIQRASQRFQSKLLDH